jgi:uncharacterized membrane protein YgdD (TMEM256/DUF423 family)
MFRNIIITCFLGVSVIILGAFGAHAFKEILTSEQLLSLETALRYQMYHVIVLLFVNTFEGFSMKQRNIISYIFFIGVLFFSGSIYLMQLTSVTAKSIWFITPLGGLFLIMGWVSMIVIFVRKGKLIKYQ